MYRSARAISAMAAHGAAYTGWDGAAVERLTADEARKITPEEFYSRFVAQRKPVLLEATLTDSSWHAPARWTNEHLAARAGDALLQVETRASVCERFGRGKICVYQTSG